MKIVDVKVQCYSYPMPPMHAGRFGSVQEATIVRIRTDDGLEGYGTARAQGGSSGRVIADAVLASARPRLLGEDPFQREKLWQKLWALDRGSFMQIFVTSAVDVALWDLAGKALNAPVWKLLGGYREQLPAYASSAHLSREELYIEEALASRAKGYGAYKIHPFGEADRDIALCRAVRDAVGPEMALMLDPVGVYDHHQAMRVGRELEKLNFYWFEEPLIDYDLRGYAELCRDLDIPVVVGETVAREHHGHGPVHRSESGRYPAIGRVLEGRHHGRDEDGSPGRGVRAQDRATPRSDSAYGRGEPALRLRDEKLRLLRGVGAGDQLQVWTERLPGHRPAGPNACSIGRGARGGGRLGLHRRPHYLHGLDDLFAPRPCCKL